MSSIVLFSVLIEVKRHVGYDQSVETGYPTKPKRASNSPVVEFSRPKYTGLTTQLYNRSL